MGTITAQILVGSPHTNDGGLIPSHCLFLSENSRPAWVMFSLDTFGNTGESERIIWIPTVENMLEDAFFMIAVHVLKHRKIIKIAESYYPDITKDISRMVLYEHFSDFDRQRLYLKCCQLKDMPKMIISVFEGSSILGQLKVVESYEMNVEVCVPVYSRLSSVWMPEERIRDSFNEYFDGTIQHKGEKK